MSRVALRFPRKAKALLYGNVLLSFGTGLIWLALNRWGQVDGAFGPERSPFEPWMLRIHGGSAFLAMTGFGYLLASHVHIGWRSRRNRALGTALVSTIVLLMVSGYLLYYTAEESLRNGISWTHLLLGISLPVTLAVHASKARRR